MLSARTSEPVRVPAVVGSKLIGNWQEAPAANVPAVDEFVLTSGQAVPPLLSRVKFAAMLGLFSVEREGKFSVVLPKFETVIVCGLSLLMLPTWVEAKVRDGGLAKFNSYTPFALASLTKTLPAPSTEAPLGNPVYSVWTVV